MGKGDKRRACCTTRQEEELRWQLATGVITFVQYERACRKLLKQGLIKRNGKVIK